VYFSLTPAAALRPKERKEERKGKKKKRPAPAHLIDPELKDRRKKKGRETPSWGGGGGGGKGKSDAENAFVRLSVRGSNNECRRRKKRGKGKRRTEKGAMGVIRGTRRGRWGREEGGKKKKKGKREERRNSLFGFSSKQRTPIERIKKKEEGGRANLRGGISSLSTLCAGKGGERRGGKERGKKRKRKKVTSLSHS